MIPTALVNDPHCFSEWSLPSWWMIHTALVNDPYCHGDWPLLSWWLTLLSWWIIHTLVNDPYHLGDWALLSWWLSPTVLMTDPYCLGDWTLPSCMACSCFVCSWVVDGTGGYACGTLKLECKYHMLCSLWLPSPSCSPLWQHFVFTNKTPPSPHPDEEVY